MAWALIDDDFPNHPKVTEANDGFPTNPGWLFVAGLCYCRKYHTGGFIPKSALATIGAGPDPRVLVDALVGAGLWDVSDRGYQIHDYARIYADDVDKAAKQAKADEATDQYRRRSEAARSGWKRRKTDDHCVESYQCGNPVEISCNASAGIGDGMGTSDLLLKKKKCEADFATFWQGYPRKDKKLDALKAWMKLTPNDDLQRQIAADIERRAQSSQWLKDGGQYIPLPASYLNGRRWEDGFVERPTVSKATVSVIRGGLEYAAGE